MFTLETNRFPASTEELATALNEALRHWIDRPVDRPMAVLAGAYPALESVAIDVSGGTAATDRRPDIQAIGASEPGPTVRSFRFVGEPIRAQGVAASVELNAKDVIFEYARNRPGRAMLVLKSAGEGRVTARIEKEDLETAALAAARAAAEPHGIAVQRIALSLTSPGPRNLMLDATITGKKMMTVVIRVRGQASLDDQFNARLSNLQADGDGVAGKLAVGLLRPHLQKLEGRQFSPLAFLLGSLQLRDLRVQAAGDVQIDAELAPGTVV